ncbi:MAG: allophanate hydrolase [Steroidobacterales bacterium]
MGGESGLSIAGGLGIAELNRAYRARHFTPVELVQRVFERIAAVPDRGVWISLVPRELALEQAYVLSACDLASLPLYGVPFAIKDNIDLAGLPTTAACPDYSYTPAVSAGAVTRLIEAGAIPIGKTNLDQFATGLVGTRSPYGVCRNSFNPQFISGGSSSGSAVAVALGLVSFALGTDTAGSGRIPAAFNNLIGLKPTCGRISPGGVVPACRSLDTISIFALTAEDAARVCRVAEGFDAAEPYSRRAAPSPRAGLLARAPIRFGVPRPDQLQFFGNQDYPRLFDAAVARFEQLGGHRVLVDATPFIDAARLLYEGPWIAERYVAVEKLLSRAPNALLPVTRQVIEAGAQVSAAAAFRAQYRLQALRRAAEQIWQDIDVLLTPTAGTIHRIEEVEADPIRLNTRLGFYTNHMNLLDLAAVAVPAGFDSAGLPFGVTIAAPAWSDYELLALAARLQRTPDARQGALARPLDPDDFEWSRDAECIAVAVCGAHMQGLPLNYQLMERGAVLLARTRTAPCYRLYALPGGPPHRPGLLRDPQHGASIEVEVWAVPARCFGTFVADISAPLAIGKVQIEDGQMVCGFLCEVHAVAEAHEITALGGWRAYLDSHR